jgi:epoxide hydrolase 4
MAFPNSRGAWNEVLPALQDRFHAVAPDQRGYARSAKPLGVEAYQIKQLVRDVLALADQLSPGRPFSIVGHDWGASVGYAAAIAAPRRVAKLVVINGVHPGAFQRALLQDEGQRAASAYIHDLRQPGAEACLVANGYEKLLGMLGRFGARLWLTPAKETAYRQAWAAPGALTGMLNWYRATPLMVPKVGELVDAAALLKLDPARLRVRMPHLVIWGMEDRALLPVARAALAEYCDSLVVREIARADHWLVHQQTEQVTRLIGAFLGD